MNGGCISLNTLQITLYSSFFSVLSGKNLYQGQIFSRIGFSIRSWFKGVMVEVVTITPGIYVLMLPLAKNFGFVSSESFDYILAQAKNFGSSQNSGARSMDTFLVMSAKPELIACIIYKLLRKIFKSLHVFIFNQGPPSCSCRTCMCAY